MAENVAIAIEGLTQFRAALRAAQVEYPKLLTLGLKKASLPILARVHASVPTVTGRLAGSYKASVRGPRGYIVSSAPYAGGAEWGRFGKWAGFRGTPPRYVWPAVESLQDRTAMVVLEELRRVVEANGWFHR